MSEYPDSLVNSLIAHLPGGALRRVVRDDGENGLWISHPDHPNRMYRIDRAEFRSTWRLYKTEGQQTNSDIGNSFDSRKESKVFLNEQELLNLPKETKEPMANSEERRVPTDREALKREILGDDLEGGGLADVTSDGDPVGANEEPLAAFDPERTDDPEAAAEEVEQVAEDADEQANARAEGEQPAEEPAKRGRKRGSKSDEDA